jgi:thiol-disulfide isomerase/thioredoxin
MKLLLIIFIPFSLSIANNQFMWHLINPWYETQNTIQKKKIGNQIINLMHEHNFGVLSPDGIRDRDGGWSRVITKNINQLDNIGKPFHLSVNTISGSTYNTRDFLGKIVFIDFFATFCAPCKVNTRNLVSLKDKYGDKISVLIISTDRDENKMIEYQSKLKYKFATHYDPNGRDSKYKTDWGASLGHMYIINKDGTLYDIHGHKDIFNKVEKIIQ